jgi:hypothetical protein
MDSLNLNVVIVKGTKREDLDEALLELSTCDADFSGENGVEYLWDEAWGNVERKEYDSDEDDDDYEEAEPEYSSNAEYVLKAELKDETDHKTIIEKFIDRWILNDSYYKQSQLDVKYDENGNAKVIAIALTY